MPVLIGGYASASNVAKLLSRADGVIVGSAVEKGDRSGELLGGQGRLRAAGARLACFSAAGFSAELGDAEQNGEAIVVDPARIFTGV